MTYWISLNDADGEPVEVEAFAEGGTYMVGGSTEANLNVTYNYARLYNFRGLDGRRAADTVGEMKSAICSLGTNRSDDYWEPSEGNAGYALSILLKWAEHYPDATWRVN